MATAGGHGERGDDRGRGHDRWRGHGRRGDDRGRGGDRWRGHGGRGGDRGRSPTGHTAACNAASGVPQAQVTTPSRLPSEGPGATSMVHAESSEPRHTTYGDAHNDDVDLNEMKKYIEELELKNTELRQKLEAAQAQIKEWSKYNNCDPLIDEELAKCHDIFLCQNEFGYKKLLELLTDPQSNLTMDAKVLGQEVMKALKQLEKDIPIYVPPGARIGKKKLKKFRRMTTFAKYIILGIIEDIYRLHRHGLSLNGNFTLDNFYWTHLKKVKLDPTLKSVVCKRDRNGMINDFHQIYQLILEMLSFHDSGLEMPDDLQSLLNLLNSDDPVKHHEIIRYNMSLLSEIGKKVHFITLYERLQQQILEDKNKSPEEEKKSEKVLNFISTHFCFPGDGKDPWSNLALRNLYVGAVYEYRSMKKGKVLEGPLELLIVWRNALCHILENSVENGVPLFKDEDLVNMLESTIPDVFNGLQKAMSEVGLLELPHLMRAMRM